MTHLRLLVARAGAAMVAAAKEGGETVGEFIERAVKYGGIAFAVWIAAVMLDQATEGLRAQGRAKICEQIGWQSPACWRGSRR